MKFFAEIRITPHKELSEPQGKAIVTGLHHLNLDKIDEVRVGKLIEMTFEANSDEEAGQLVKEACEKLLANSLTETFTFSIEAIVEEKAD